MTFSIIPVVDLRLDPSNIENVLKYWHADVVVTSEFALSKGGSPSLVCQVGTGTCILKGYNVQITVQETITVDASNTVYVYIQLIRNGNNEVTGAQLVKNLTGTTPADAIPICKCVTSGTDITTQTSLQDLKEDNAVGIFLQRSSDPATPENQTTTKKVMLAGDSNNKILKYKHYANGAFQDVYIWG